MCIFQVCGKITDLAIQVFYQSSYTKIVVFTVMGVVLVLFLRISDDKAGGLAMHTLSCGRWTSREGPIWYSRPESTRDSAQLLSLCKVCIWRT